MGSRTWYLGKLCYKSRREQHEREQQEEKQKY